jgi:hypothetical protein
MKQRAPDVLDLLCAISIPKLKESDKLCVAYGILLNNRWKELNLIQKSLQPYLEWEIVQQRRI